MASWRQHTSERLVRVSVQHALDAREIRQRHLSHECPAPSSCAQIFWVANTISQASLWLARRLHPVRQPAR